LAINYKNSDEYEGTKKTNQVSLSYAPHFELFEHKLALQPAFELGFFSSTYYYWGYPSQWDHGTPDTQIPWPTGRKKSNIVISSGLLFFTKRFYGGFAVHNINKPQYELFSYDGLPVRYTLHGGANLNVGNCILSPNFLAVKQGDFSRVQLGVRVKYKILTIGVDGSGNTIIPEIGLQNRFFKLSYCYGYLLDVYMTNRVLGIHELHFNWFFKHKNKKQLSLRMI